MRKVILITLFIVGLGASAFCFPDMGKYPHDVVKVENALAKTSKRENYIEMSRIRFEGFNGLYGFCPMTHYTIWVNELGGEPNCSVSSSAGKIETSHFNMETAEGGVVGKYYFFEDENDIPMGRVTVMFAGGKAYAVWQTWVA